MVEVNYHLGHKFASKRLNIDVERLLVCNNSPSYFTYPIKWTSRFDGFVTTLNSKTVKVVDQIIPQVGGGIVSIHHKGYKVEVIRENLAEEFFLPNGFTTMIYSLSKKIPLQILFDIKELNDAEEWGRNYKIEIISNKTVIYYEKLDCYVAINCPIEFNETWHKKEYEYDKNRSSPHYNRWVYSPGKFFAHNLIITLKKTKKEVLAENEYIETNLQRITSIEEKEFLINIENKGNNDVNIAYNLSKYYLKKLGTKRGIIAGFPWFTQVWTRDELISLKGMYLAGEIEYVKSRLIKYLDLIHADGRLVNHFTGQEKNADGGGWLFRRLLDYYLLSRETSLAFDQKERKKIQTSLETASNCLTKYFKKDHLLHSTNYQTWMDSLRREGARVEIQALDTNLYALLRLITKETSYLTQERKLVKEFKRKFLKGAILKDEVNDLTIRPNVFLAGYVGLRLLKEEEWAKIYRKAIKSLWNEWGGLSTIDKLDSRFHNNHTGENPESYHNGDSWFFINNIAGIAMSRQKGFSKYVKMILQASTKNILEMGSLGCASEVSSSSKLESKGAWLQAWSLATYIELVEVIENG